MPVLSNPRHELFAQAVAKGKSQREAYLSAGYEVSSDKSADESASRLSSEVKVQARIAELQDIAAKRAGITIERIAVELAKIGFADITSAVKWGEAIAVKDKDGEEYALNDVALVASEELPPDVSAAIAEVRKTRDGVSIKFHDKRAALVDLGKHLGMFKEVHEHRGTGTDGAILTEDASDRDIARSLLFALAKAAKGQKE